MQNRNTVIFWIAVSLMLCLQVLWHAALRCDIMICRVMENLYINKAEAGHYRKHDVAFGFDFLIPAALTGAACGLIMTGVSRTGALKQSVFAASILCMLQFVYLLLLPNELWWLHLSASQIISQSAIGIVYACLVFTFGFALVSECKLAARGPKKMHGAKKRDTNTNED
jgi:hypothetical protein